MEVQHTGWGREGPGLAWRRTKALSSTTAELSLALTTAVTADSASSCGRGRHAGEEGG